MDEPKSTNRPKAAEATEVPASGATPIYGPFFGLAEAPFDLTSDSRFLFLTNNLREALSNLQYGLTSAKGFTVLIGEAGTGKTTLVSAALADLESVNSRYVLMSNPTLGRSEFYEFLSAELGFTPRAAESKTQFLTELEADIRARFAKGGMTSLIVDEAQSLPHALLEEIRLLGNIETPTSKLLNIILCGQPELADRLNEPSLRQLKQRVVLRCELHPLTQNETSAYIAGRLRIAGGVPGQIFTAEAVRAIYKASGGIPRTINVLCDNALVSGFAAQVKPVNAAFVADVCRDFDLDRSSEPDLVQTDHPPEPQRSTSPATGPATPVTPKPEREMFPTVQTKKKRSPFSFFS
jgi:general secretion pathway protein A